MLQYLNDADPAARTDMEIPATGHRRRLFGSGSLIGQPSWLANKRP
jgi:hypothetical protein